MRGDFFCLPFGGNEAPFRGERHPPHGETANANWRLVDKSRHGGAETLHLRMDTRVRQGRVDKFLTVRKGHPAVYCRHVVSGMSGPMSLGHHAILKFRSPGLISMSPFLQGRVYPQPVERPEARGYSCLVPGAAFDSLERVPSLFGNAGLSRYPARRGFEDIVLLAGDPAPAFAWTAVSFPEEGHVWLALKDPRVLRHTLMWHSNGGRHYPPWNGRHVDTLGLEEVTAFFHEGLASSVRANALSRQGHPTHLRLDPRRPLDIRYVMAVVPVPRRFGRVRAVRATSDGVLLASESGGEAEAAIDTAFLRGEERERSPDQGDGRLALT